jgi:hypothetical protein
MAKRGAVPESSGKGMALGLAIKQPMIAPRQWGARRDALAETRLQRALASFVVER